METLQFTRALLGLVPPPFLLVGVIQQHLSTCQAAHPECVAETEESLYVDDLINNYGDKVFLPETTYHKKR